MRRSTIGILAQQGAQLNLVLPDFYIMEEDSERYITEEDNTNNILTIE